MGMQSFDSELKRASQNDRYFMRAMKRGEMDLLSKVDTALHPKPGIYCIFNSELKMMYIGCSIDVSNRIQTHKQFLVRGEHICKQMNIDYLKNPETFSFFCIEYVMDRFELQESLRVSILNRETQYMKRVPHLRLYNNMVPVSLSERLLSIDCPAKEGRIKIADICSRLEMSPDSIRSNGFQLTDELTLSASIEFVRKRTVANGRWAADKAQNAIQYLAELESRLSGYARNSDTIEDLLAAGGVLDYFDDLIISGHLVNPPLPPTPAYLEFMRSVKRVRESLDEFKFPGIWEMTYYFGMLVTVGGLVFLLKWVACLIVPFYVFASFGIMQSAKRPGRTGIAENGGLVVVAIMEMGGFFIHNPLLNWAVWQMESALPWRKMTLIKDPEIPALLIRVNQIPGIYATVFSAFIAFICVYAVANTLAETKIKERKSENDA